jgi:hypothetical protein
LGKLLAKCMMQAPILLAHRDPVATRQVVYVHGELDNALVDGEKKVQHALKLGCTPR